MATAPVTFPDQVAIAPDTSTMTAQNAHEDQAWSEVRLPCSTGVRPRVSMSRPVGVDRYGSYRRPGVGVLHDARRVTVLPGRRIHLPAGQMRIGFRWLSRIVNAPAASIAAVWCASNDSIPWSARIAKLKGAFLVELSVGG